MSGNTTTSSRAERRPLWRRLAAAAMVLGLVAGGMTLGVAPANAATMGPSYDGGNGHIGAWVVNGQHVYCLESAKGRPTGATGGGGLQGWGAMGPDQLAQLSYVIAAHGQSGDARVTSAVAMYVWSVADTAAYNSHGMSGDAWFIGRVPAAQRSTVLGHLSYIRSDAARITASRGQLNGSAALNVQMFNSFDGQVTVSTDPYYATGTLYLDGATVAGTGATSVAVGNGSIISIKGAPLDSQGKYSVTANASFSAPVGSGYGGAIAVYTTGAAQALAGTTPPLPTSINFNAATYVTDPIEVGFSPVITTRVASKIVQAGQPFTDIVAFGVAADSEPWRKWEDGTYFEVIAKATVYGPFASQPAESATVPAGSPVAGYSSLKTSDVSGPTIEYVAATPQVAPSAGFYTWVWQISASDQDIFTQQQLPAGYEFADRFGQVAETHISPFRPQGTSQISAPTVPLGGQVTDTLNVTHTGGPWLQNGGINMPVVYRSYTWFIPGNPAVAPPVTQMRPANAVLLDTQLFEASGWGPLTTRAATAPTGQTGHISFQWCAASADQYAAFAGWTIEWCDSVGLPNETASVAGPTVTTKAKTEVILGAAVPQSTFDVATVTGPIPAQPSRLYFEAYAERYDANGNPVCGVDNIIWASGETVVDHAGDYTSASFVPEQLIPAHWLPAAGGAPAPKIWFVEKLYSVNWEMLAQGVCGLGNETTVVHNPTLQTKASTAVVFPDGATDTAILAGTWPAGSSIVFSAHKTKAEDPKCTVGNQVWSSPTAIPIVNGTLEYTSAPADLPIGTIAWVATVLGADGTALRTGVCGDPSEMTFVDTPFHPAGTSQISGFDLALGAEVFDTLTTGHTGTWLDDQLGPMPVIYRATAYFVEGDPAVDLPITAAPPAEAVVLGTQLLEARGKQELVTDPVTLPTGKLGHVSYQWCVLAADQPIQYEGWTKEWCDDFGLPLESASILPPIITTEAKSDVVLWTDPVQTAHDVAIVGGTIPVDPMTITFAAYSESYDVDGVATCTPDNLVWESAELLEVDEAGSYESESFIPEEVVPVELLPEPGSTDPLKLWFIESAHSVNDELLARGECGVENETTILHNPELASKAKETTLRGTTANDTAILDGTWAEGGNVVFAAYLQADGVQSGQAEFSCTPDNLVWSSSESIEVEPIISDEIPVVDGDVLAAADLVDETAGDLPAPSETGVYASEDAVLPVGTIAWVATLQDEDGDALRVGECGDPAEITVVRNPPPVLAMTGFDGMIAVAIATLLLLTGVVLLALHIAARGRRVEVQPRHRELDS